jgi:hypothetical protein
MLEEKDAQMQRTHVRAEYAGRSVRAAALRGGIGA